MMTFLEVKVRALEEKNRILREHINDAKETGYVMKERKKARTQRSASESETENQTDEEAERRRKLGEARRPHIWM